MSDTTELGAEQSDAAPSTIINVPILKGGKNAFLAVNLAEIPDEAYQQVIVEGLKAVLNARMSKVGAITKLEGAELSAANSKALEIANENLANLKANKLKAKGRKSSDSTIPREVLTEAMKIGRNMVKDLIREAKGYPSQYAASEITAMAKKILEQDPSIVEMARKNIDARKGTETKLAIDILSLGKPDPKLVAKAAEKAAERKTQLSAKQAGGTTKRGANAPPPPRKSRGDVPVVHH